MKIGFFVMGGAMFKGLKRAVYRVPDMEKAKQWYRTVLAAEPVLDAPFAVIFSIGSSSLVLAPSKGPAQSEGDDVVAYWGVDDVRLAYDRLIQAGASPHAEITTVFGTRRGAVRDPFGNIVGIIGTETDTGKGSVEHRPSETAMNTTFSRALAASDERDEFRGPDYLAERFLPDDRRRALNDRAARDWLIKNPPGMYEYIIARTKFFDRIVDQALRARIPQIVFLGAGYDSRPYRFADLMKDTSIFEVDASPTQQHKRGLLQKARISPPERLTYVPINFHSDDLKQVLRGAGYDKNKKTVFVWEGVTFYLLPEVIDDTLSFITMNSPRGSSICFDYRILMPDNSQAYGVKEFMTIMTTMHASEPLRFGLEEGEITSFLLKRGFTVLDRLAPEEMEKRFFPPRNGSPAGKVTAMFGFVHAAASGQFKELPEICSLTKEE